MTSALDISLLIVAAVFAIGGWRKGFTRKIFSFLALVASLAVAAKFGPTLSHAAFVPLGLRPNVAIFFAYFVIIGGIMFAQSFLYSMLVRDIVEGTWNHIAGMTLGVVEGALAMSAALIILSLYFGIPSEETKATSSLYIPVKNIAPRVYDTAYNLFPEVEDFYEQVYKAVTDNNSKEVKKK